MRTIHGSIRKRAALAAALVFAGAAAGAAARMVSGCMGDGVVRYNPPSGAEPSAERPPDKDGGGQPPGEVVLSWDLPRVQADGGALEDLAGFRVYYGKDAGASERVVDVGLVSEYRFRGLAAGTYYFKVSAYDKAGNESRQAGPVSKSVR